MELLIQRGEKMKNLNQLVSLAMVALCSTSLNAESIYPEAELITDPAAKLIAGFEADDILYKLPENMMKHTGEEAVSSVNGIGGLVHVGYLGVESQGRKSDFIYSSQLGVGDIYRDGGTELFADILLELPDGYSLSWIRAWGYDSSASDDLQFFVYSSCLPNLTAGAITSTQLGTITSSGSAGNWSASVSLDVEVDNTLCTYWVRTRFNSGDNTNRLYKIRAELNPIL